MLFRSWNTRLCLDLDPKWVGAEALTTGKSQMIAGYPLIANNCSKPTDVWTSDWTWDASTGEILNSLYLLEGQKWCVAPQGTRANSPIVTVACDGSDSQVWTWNSGTGMFKNKAAAMATLVPSSSAQGASIVLGSPTLEQSTSTLDAWGGI